ncbi:unnamed protein product [Ranitomeya imitator]|uniref:Uncharacterized protein n=1 Tax=Ranitomeya imitator TaxID=111125 RepID=A0ABN9KYP0_9NEOB|nr:unnamed protein product [Ranitomeya imitator]
MTGSIVRSVSAVTFLMNTGTSNLVWLFVGQSICAVAQPLVLFVPAKLAAVWFPEHQRATANMIASMSNPFGIFLANILSPVIVSRAEDLPILHCVYGIPAVLACILATAGVHEKAPPTPPSVSAVNSASEPFFAGLKQFCPYLHNGEKSERKSVGGVAGTETKFCTVTRLDPESVIGYVVR